MHTLATLIPAQAAEMRQAADTFMDQLLAAINPDVDTQTKRLLASYHRHDAQLESDNLNILDELVCFGA